MSKDLLNSVLMSSTINSVTGLFGYLYSLAHEEKFKREIRETVDNSVKILYFDVAGSGDIGFSAKYHTEDIEDYHKCFNDDRRILNESILVFMQDVLFDLVGREIKALGSYKEVMT